jgi:hypothetical protein
MEFAAVESWDSTPAKMSIMAVADPVCALFLAAIEKDSRPANCSARGRRGMARRRRRIAEAGKRLSPGSRPSRLWLDAVENTISQLFVLHSLAPLPLAGKWPSLHFHDHFFNVAQLSCMIIEGLQAISSSVPKTMQTIQNHASSNAIAKWIILALKLFA